MEGTMLSLIGQAAVIVLFLASCVGVVIALQYFARRFIEEEEDEPKWKVIRGEAVVTLEEAKEDLEKNALPPELDPRTIPHGGLFLPRSEENKHKATMGITGTGKTISMLAALAAVAPRLVRPLPLGPAGDLPGATAPTETVCVVAYDDKRILPPFVAGL